MSSVDDIRILAEMAEEIDDRGFTALPGSLRSCIKGKRAIKVAETLERVSVGLLSEKHGHADQIDRLMKEIDGLRNEMQSLTDSTLRTIGSK